MGIETNTETENRLECRMYESNYPEVDTVVMVKVTSVAEIGAYVNLVEYNNAEGLILLSELFRTRIRSVGSVVKVGTLEPAMVLNVDKKKGHIDLSKRRVSKEDVLACEERFSKSKFVHSIMGHVAETMDLNLEDLYIHVGWPLYRKYGHAFEAFKLIVTEPDCILNSLTREVKNVRPNGQEVTKMVPALSDNVKDAFVQNICRRMTLEPVKIRADVELTCFQFDGVLHIKEALRKAQAAGNKDGSVKIQLMASPLYVFTTHTLDKEKGILVLTDAIEVCTEVIESRGGKLEVKKQPRAVSERDGVIAYEEEVTDEEVTDEEYSKVEEEVADGEDSKVEEDTGMEDVD